MPLEQASAAAKQAANPSHYPGFRTCATDPL
jgi:hypothetical protein